MPYLAVKTELSFSRFTAWFPAWTEILFLLGSSALSCLTTDLVFFLLGALFLISVFACALLPKQESDQ